MLNRQRHLRPPSCPCNCGWTLMELLPKHEAEVNDLQRAGPSAGSFRLLTLANYEPPARHGISLAALQLAS